MTKETFWFKHDSDAADDDKTMLLIEQMGLEGYGIYWILIEKLRERENYKMSLSAVPSLARRYMTTPVKMKAVIMEYGLFQKDEEGFFYSESLIKRMRPLNEIKNKRSLAGKIGMANRWKTKNAENQRVVENCDASKEKQCYNNDITPLLQCYNNDITNGEKRKEKGGKEKNREETKEKIDNILSTKKKTKNFGEFVERIYSLYPTKCPVRNTSLGKSYKDKERIQKLMSRYSEEDIEAVLKAEIDEKYGKHYMQNFSTFLNNFPDPQTICQPTLFEQEQTNRDTNELIINGQTYR